MVPITIQKFKFGQEIVDAVVEIVRCDKTDDVYKYGCVFIGMTDVDALKIDIYQIFNDL